jgi:hypothetical protein
MTEIVGHAIVEDILNYQAEHNLSNVPEVIAALYVQHYPTLAEALTLVNMPGHASVAISPRVVLIRTNTPGLYAVFYNNELVGDLEVTGERHRLILHKEGSIVHRISKAFGEEVEVAF